MNKIAKQFIPSMKLYLLGKDQDGIKVWLKKPSWDCGWYWGFGYIATFENNKIVSSKQDRHTHWNGFIVGGKIGKEYVHHLYDNPNFESCVLTKKESWTLAELMKTFYNLKEAAEFFGRGESHITENPCRQLLKKSEWVEEINQKLLPAVFAEIDQLLMPKGGN